MKKQLTELVFILDRSGSMAAVTEDTIGGFNAMMEKQKATPGKTLVSTVLFDHEILVLHDRVPLDAVPVLTEKEYYSRGSTALLDAVGGAIHHIGNIHKYARPEDVPEKTLFIITTDGLENASCHYTLNKVKAMIERQQHKYGWEFLFLGANMDAVTTAGRMGIRAGRAVTFHSDSVGTRLNYEVMSETVCAMRAAPAAPLADSWKKRIEEDYRARGGTGHGKGAK